MSSRERLSSWLGNLSYFDGLDFVCVCVSVWSLLKYDVS